MQRYPMLSGTVFSFHPDSSFRTTNDRIQCCDFSPDGKLLAFCGYSKMVQICSMDDYTCKTSGQNHGRRITDVRFSSDSKMLATSLVDTTVQLWNAAEPRSPWLSYMEHKSAVRSVDFHPQNTEIICSCDSHKMRLWRSDQTSLRVTEGAAMSRVRFQPGDGRHVATASDDLISISDVEAGKQIMTFKGRGDAVKCLLWDEEGKCVVAATWDSVTVWSTSSGDRTHQRETKERFNSCIFHPARRWVLIAGGDKTLDIWDLTTEDKITIDSPASLITALAGTRMQVGASATAKVAVGTEDRGIKMVVVG